MFFMVILKLKLMKQENVASNIGSFEGQLLSTLLQKIFIIRGLDVELTRVSEWLFGPYMNIQYCLKQPFL